MLRLSDQQILKNPDVAQRTIGPHPTPSGVPGVPREGMNQLFANASTVGYVMIETEVAYARPDWRFDVHRTIRHLE